MDERAGILNWNEAARSVGMGEHTGRYCETERFAGLEIDHQLRARGGAHRCNSGRFRKRHLQDLNAFINFLVSGFHEAGSRWQHALPGSLGFGVKHRVEFLGQKYSFRMAGSW
jgi:hypothetical protein